MILLTLQENICAWVSFSNKFQITLLKRDSGRDVFTWLWRIRPEVHREPRNEVAFTSLTKRLVGFEPETFQFWLQSNLYFRYGNISIIISLQHFHNIKPVYWFLMQLNWRVSKWWQTLGFNPFPVPGLFLEPLETS